MRRGSERLARLFLKPQAGRFLGAVWLAEGFLRPLVKLFPLRNGKEAHEVRSILVFDPGALGDMAMLAPFLRNLRVGFPTSKIVLAGRALAGDFLREQGLVDECVSIDVPWTKRETSRLQRHQPFSWRWRDFFRSLWQLRSREFDLGFAAGWGGDLRGNFAIWLAGAKRRVGYGYAGGKFLLTDVVQPDLMLPHVVDRNLKLLEHTGMRVVRDSGSLTVTADDELAAAELLDRYGVRRGKPVIGIHPGAGSPVREWGDERFAEVARLAADQFGAKVLWFTDPLKPRPLPANVDAIPLELPFSRLVAVLSRCQLFICNDSGTMHAAAALKVPVVAVFGPQRPEWFGPWGDGHRVVIRHDIWCRPCADNCRWKEPYCLRLISVEQVMEAVREMLQNVAPREMKAGCAK